VLLGAVGLIFLAYIGRELIAPAPEPRPLRSRPAPPVVPAVGTPPPTAPGSYTLIASRNLFSPTRSETPGSGVAAGAAALQPKPNLYGVVLRNGSAIAYLEDPLTKRVAGYRIGDSIAGGTLKSITADRVVLTRPDGPVDVQLHDPARPRAVVGPVPGQPGAPPGVLPTLPPNVAVPQVPTQPQLQVPPVGPFPGQSGAQSPLGRRPFRPGLLPPAGQSPSGNAPAQ
jgi:hypothetical protein